MQSLRSLFYYYLTKRAVAQFTKRNLPLAKARAARDKQSKKLFPLPNGVTALAAVVGGVNGQWLDPIPASPNASGISVTSGTSSTSNIPGILLYLHGGAYIQGSVETHRGLAGALAQASSCKAFIADYRLAPEHPFPAATDDSLQVYLALLSQYPSTPIAIAGDSAGGGLALALAQQIRDQGLRPPCALALLSPWTDLTLGNATHRSKASVDPFFPNSTLLHEAAMAYAGSTPLTHPLLSAQYANLQGLPPTLIHVGAKEALLDDALVLYRNMEQQGVAVSLKEYPHMWHVWQVFVGRLAQADTSVRELGVFIKQQFVK